MQAFFKFHFEKPFSLFTVPQILRWPLPCFGVSKRLEFFQPLHKNSILNYVLVEPHEDTCRLGSGSNACGVDGAIVMAVNQLVAVGPGHGGHRPNRRRCYCLGTGTDRPLPSNRSPCTWRSCRTFAWGYSLFLGKQKARIVPGLLLALFTHETDHSSYNNPRTTSCPQ